MSRSVFVSRVREGLPRLAVLCLSLLLLAYVDVIVLERVLKPMAAKYSIPWGEFQIPVSWAAGVRPLWWHAAFIPLALGLFALLAAASQQWRYLAAGVLLFSTGWEDILYYLLQGKGIPASLPILDLNPALSWTRSLTATEHVSLAGLLAVAGIGAVIAVVILFSRGRGDSRAESPSSTA